MHTLVAPKCLIWRLVLLNADTHWNYKTTALLSSITPRYVHLLLNIPYTTALHVLASSAPTKMRQHKQLERSEISGVLQVPCQVGYHVLLRQTLSTHAYVYCFCHFCWMLIQLVWICVGKLGLIARVCTTKAVKHCHRNGNVVTLKTCLSLTNFDQNDNISVPLEEVY